VPINPEFSGSSAPLDPVYTDENVTIFALPIIPEDTAKDAISTTSSAVSNARLQASSLSKLKRKRSPSPFSPSKHSDPPHHTSGQDSRSSSALPAGKRKHTNIGNLMKTPNFNPRVLEGTIAHQWRELVVQTIFKKTQPTPNEKMLQTASANAPAGDNTTTMPIPRRVYPPGFQSQLPPFSLPYHKVTNTPETKPTLAYIIVGPRVRGKFDAAKAKKLRIPVGSLRGELTRGKAITFMVPGELSGGDMVQRTVQPEEVIGPSESPSVSAACICLDPDFLKANKWLTNIAVLCPR
jgi:ribonuclease Z